MQKIALITGASTGLGCEMARQLAAAGYDLALVARRQTLLDDLRQDLLSSGRRILVLVADVSRWDEIQKAVQRTEQELGPIDLLIANAGVSLDAPLSRFDVVQARQVYEVNVIGLMQTVAAALPSMMSRKRGHIVGISSLASYVSVPRSTVYCSSKAAVSSYLEGLRIELMPHGVQVTTVCPGFVKTPMTQKNKFKMPFLVEAPAAVRLILKGVAQSKSIIHFPLPLYLIILLIRCIPKPLFRRLLQNLRP